MRWLKGVLCLVEGLSLERKLSRLPAAAMKGLLAVSGLLASCAPAILMPQHSNVQIAKSEVSLRRMKESEKDIKGGPAEGRRLWALAIGVSLCVGRVTLKLRGPTLRCNSFWRGSWKGVSRQKHQSSCSYSPGLANSHYKELKVLGGSSRRPSFLLCSSTYHLGAQIQHLKVGLSFHGCLMTNGLATL